MMNVESATGLLVDFIEKGKRGNNLVYVAYFSVLCILFDVFFTRHSCTGRYC